MDSHSPSCKCPSCAPVSKPARRSAQPSFTSPLKPEPHSRFYPSCTSPQQLQPQVGQKRQPGRGAAELEEEQKQAKGRPHGWQVDDDFDLDAEGRGEVLYRLHGGGWTFHFFLVALKLDEAQAGPSFVVTRAGDPGDGCYRVEQGLLKVSMIAPTVT